MRNSGRRSYCGECINTNDYEINITVDFVSKFNHGATLENKFDVPRANHNL